MFKWRKEKCIHLDTPNLALYTGADPEGVEGGAGGGGGVVHE